MKKSFALQSACAVTIAVFGFLMVAPPRAHALGTGSFDSKAGTALQVGVGNSMQANLDGSIGVSGGIYGTEQEAALSSTAALQAEPRVELDATTSSSAQLDEAATIVVTRADLEDGKPLESNATAESETALRLHAEQLMKKDENVSKVRFDSDEVSVWYDQKAKLLGFIPVKIRAKAEADNDGKVAVRYPWYQFLASGVEEENLEADLQARVNSVLQSDLGLSDNTSQESLSVQTKARLAAELQTALKQ